MLFSIALIAWLVGCWASFSSGNRRLATVALLLGFGCVALSLRGETTYLGVAGLAVLAAVIWTANDVMRRNPDQTAKAKAVCCAALAFLLLGCGLIFFMTGRKPRLITLGFDYNDYGFLEGFFRMPLFLSPLLGAALLAMSLRLWRQLHPPSNPE